MSTAVHPATRAELLRTRRRLARLTKGTELLRRKREALVTELFRLARPAADARAEIDAAAARAYPLLVEALASHGVSGLTPLAWPTRSYPVEVVPGSVWGVVVSRIASRPSVPRTPEARALPSGATGFATAEATAAFEALTEVLLEAAPQEMLLRRIGDALAQTSRQVHTLERRIAPRLARETVRIERTLDEREREERLRLRQLLRRRRRG